MAHVASKCLLHSTHQRTVKATPAGAAHAQHPQVERSGASWPLDASSRTSALPLPHAMKALPSCVSRTDRVLSSKGHGNND
eukprot:6186872-Pleurochrysis_carterae.AAC.2